jgi:hypothetical protein
VPTVLQKSARGVPPSYCTPEKADAKRRATQRAHDVFTGRLEGYLTTGEEDIGMSFTKTIKDTYPKFASLRNGDSVPDSSKKRIRGSRE